MLGIDTICLWINPILSCYMVGLGPILYSGDLYIFYIYNSNLLFDDKKFYQLS